MESNCFCFRRRVCFARPTLVSARKHKHPFHRLRRGVPIKPFQSLSFNANAQAPISRHDIQHAPDTLYAYTRA